MPKWLKALAAGALIVAAYAAANEISFRYFCHVDDLATRAIRDLAFVPRSPQPLSVLGLGDSTAAFNVNAGALPRAASLAAMNGSAPEAFFLYRRFLSRYAPPRCVLLSLSLRGKSQDRAFWEQFVRNRFYTFEELGEVYDTSQRLGGEPAVSYSRWVYWGKILLLEARLAGFDLSALQEGVFRLHEVSRTHAVFLARMRRGNGPVAPATPAGLTGGAELDVPAAPVRDPVQNDFFRRLLDLASGKSKVFLLPPLFPGPNDSPPVRSYLEAYTKLVAGSAEGRPIQTLAVPVLDKGFFLRTGHLNEAGARFLMVHIASQLAACNEQPASFTGSQIH